MILSTSPRAASIASWMRGLVLVFAALFASHDAVYLVRFGPGAGYANAMSAGGHDGYWLPASLGLVIGASIAFLSVVHVIIRLRRDIGAPPHAAAVTPGGPSYGAELARLWLRLLVAVGLLFAVQENIEGLLANGGIAGLDPLFGHDAWLVPPILAATTFLLAAVGAVLRWRVRILQARVEAARRARAFGRPIASAPSRRWLTMPAGGGHGPDAARPDAGRAPPIVIAAAA
ncbi:MAG TPA: hypothetical protein VIZ22_10775 [Candidatus Limnocylindrales bacterium]